MWVHLGDPLIPALDELGVRARVGLRKPVALAVLLVPHDPGLDREVVDPRHGVEVVAVRAVAGGERPGEVPPLPQLRLAGRRMKPLRARLVDESGRPVDDQRRPHVVLGGVVDAVVGLPPAVAAVLGLLDAGPVDRNPIGPESGLAHVLELTLGRGLGEDPEEVAGDLGARRRGGQGDGDYGQQDADGKPGCRGGDESEPLSNESLISGRVSTSEGREVAPRSGTAEAHFTCERISCWIARSAGFGFRFCVTRPAPGHQSQPISPLGKSLHA